MPATPGALDDCPHCRSRRFHFQRVYRFGLYEGQLREAVLRAKTFNGEGVAAALGSLLGRSHGPEIRTEQIDLAVAVPSHWIRRLQRGANSAAAMMRTIAREIGIPASADVLVCRRNIRKQSTLPISERRRNVRGAFRLSWGYDIKGATLLLVDDVMTTGATLHEVAGVLRQGGAQRVVVAVIARAVGPDW